MTGMNQSHRILVVDDEPLIRRLTQTLLESVGFQVFTAANGDEALAIFEQRPEGIDLVLLDLAMPGKSGEEVLQELRRLDAAVRVLILSAHVDGADSAHLQ